MLWRPKNRPRCQSGSTAGLRRESRLRTQLLQPRAEAYWFPCRCHRDRSSRWRLKTPPDSARPRELRRNTVAWASLRRRESEVLRLRRSWRGFPPGKLAGIAAEAKYAVRRQRLELTDQSEIARCEESWVSELLHFIRESHEVGRHQGSRGLC